MFGIDISNIQKTIHLNKAKGVIDFVILKASEGAGFKDKSTSMFASQLFDLDMLIGCYHFCRPDLNAYPDAEVNNFLEAVYRAKLDDKAILIADWETSTYQNEEWVQEFCSQVVKLTGIMPFIYGSSSVLYKLRTKVGNKIPFWVAQWPNKIRYNIGEGPEGLSPKIEFPWKIWQYSSCGLFPGYSGRIDLDFSIMTREEWESYCHVVKKETITKDMQWAIDIGIFLGYGDSTFRPKEPITREQVASVLNRYNSYIIRECHDMTQRMIDSSVEGGYKPKI